MAKQTGLTNQEALKRLKKQGKNEIKKIKKTSLWNIFISQFYSPLMLLLIGAALISFLIGYLPGQKSDFIDAILILIIVFISGISGFIQEYRTEKSVEALQKMSMPNSRVLRDKKVIVIPVADIVTGDIILIEAGDIIPADAQLLETNDLRIDESILSGESKHLKKNKGDLIFMDTSIHTGHGRAIVLATGMRTKIGKIAKKIQEIKIKKTSFEKEIEDLSKKIFWLTGGISIIIFLGNLFKYDLYTSFLTSISLAVAAIPEGLPAVVMLSLAMGAKNMYKNNALIKRINVVESIGSIDIICSDKTGTMTKNEMTVSEIFINENTFKTEADNINIEHKKNLDLIIKCGVICNNAKASGYPQKNRKYIGEQTEIALIKVGEKYNLYKEDLDNQYERISETSFTSERKMMSVVIKTKNKKYQIFSKGAPEVLIKKCSKILKDGKIKKLTLEEKHLIIQQNNNLSSNMLRVLGFAYNNNYKLKDKAENGLIWIGLQAIIDPPHPEMEEVLTECSEAGIRVIMITGDNAQTAQAIANRIGLKSSGVIIGEEIDKMNNQELKEKLKSNINIYARTSPFHKLKILEILEKKNRVAMTGDGVNDALAIKKAQVGIAMGKKGTMVAKESSDIILLNDNFSTIIKAIKDGRRIFDNIRKFINYLFVSNIAEVLVIFLATIFLSLKEPILLPAQILWINLLTDGFPALALGVDPAREDIMKKPPRKKNEPIINKKLGWLIIIIGLYKTFILFLTFLLLLPLGEDIARTTLFTGFILYEFVRIAVIRSQEKLTWWANPWLLLALLVSVILQIIIIYTPLGHLFNIVSLKLIPWLILLVGVIIGYFLAIVISKIINKYVSD